MKKSNIFAYIELTKLVEEVETSASEKLRQTLKSQSAYFNIIEPRYFSEDLISEWENILSVVKQKGAKVNDEGKVISNAISNTIDYLSDKECQLIVERVYNLYHKVKVEFKI